MSAAHYLTCCFLHCKNCSVNVNNFNLFGTQLKWRHQLHHIYSHFLELRLLPPSQINASQPNAWPLTSIFISLLQWITLRPTFIIYRGRDRRQSFQPWMDFFRSRALNGNNNTWLQTYLLDLSRCRPQCHYTYIHTYIIHTKCLESRVRFNKPVNYSTGKWKRHRF